MYGRPPEDFDTETAQALTMALPQHEARMALAVAKGIGAAMGGGKALASLVYEATGSREQAMQVAAQDYLARACRG